MAPKAARAAPGPPSSGPRTRSSSSKAGNSSTARTAGGVGVSKAAPASKRKIDQTAPPSAQGVARGSASSAGSKAGKPSSKAGNSQKSTQRKSNVLSPVPVSNLQSRFEQSASELDTVDSASNEISFTAINDEQFFDQIVLKFPRLQRFKDAWLFSGNFDPATMVLAYNPKSFVEDLQRDIANLDRPSAHNLAVFVMEQFATCSEFNVSLRRDWAAGYTALTRQRLDLPDLEVVQVEDDEVTRAAREVPLLSDGTSNVRELKQFVTALANKVHNSETVFGVNAGFTVVPHDDILLALRESAEAAKAANGNSSANKVQVNWQRLLKWNRESWLAFERKWWDSVNQSVQNGQYLKMQNLIDTGLFNDMQQDLKIPSLQWFKFPEIEFLRRAHGWHGPVNKEDALLLLSDHQCACGTVPPPYRAFGFGLDFKQRL